MQLVFTYFPAALFTIFPLLFIFKIICNILKCLRKETNMKGKVVLIPGASSRIEVCFYFLYIHWVLNWDKISVPGLWICKKRSFSGNYCEKGERLRKVAERPLNLALQWVQKICWWYNISLWPMYIYTRLLFIHCCILD